MVGLPLSKASGNPSDGKTEAKLKRIGDKLPVDNPDRIGSQGYLGSRTVKIPGKWKFVGPES